MTGEPPAGAPAGRTRAAVGWFWPLFATFVVAFRIPILVGWIVAAALATIYLPAVAASGSLGGLVSGNSPAVRAEIDAARLFGVPLASAEVELVQRDPAGFSLAVQEHAARHALAVDRAWRAGSLGSKARCRSPTPGAPYRPGAGR